MDKVRPTRANVKVSEPSIPVDGANLSRAGGVLKSTPSRGPLTLDALQASSSPLESGRLVEVVEDWCRYKGSLYDHLTGKSPRLEPGKDYSVGSDGSIDLASYQAARDRKVTAWENDPSVRSRFESFEALCRNNRDQISWNKKDVALFEGSRLVQKKRYTTPFFRENNWLYYESNYCNPQTGAMTQPERETNTAYRVYLTVPQDKVTRAFATTINKLNKVGSLNRHGFQAKTADLDMLVPADKARLIHQRDQMVFYFGEKGAKEALPVFQELARENPDWFQQPGVLMGQPLPSADSATPLNGIRVSSEVHGLGRSFSDVHSNLLEGCLDQIAQAVNHPDIKAKISKKHSALGSRLAKLNTRSGTQEVLSSVLVDDEGRSFLARQLEANYPAWVGRRGLQSHNPAFRAQASV
jgi:hypothetical protein